MADIVHDVEQTRIGKQVTRTEIVSLTCIDVQRMYQTKEFQNRVHSMKQANPNKKWMNKQTVMHGLYTTAS